MNLAGKTCLVTGANSGIGKITAMELAKMQARVVMLCRNRKKAESARKEIFRVSGNSKIYILLCDLSSLQQVHETAHIFQQHFHSLDILVNNAGFFPGNERQETEDGIEKTFAVNHLSHYTLTLLLLDLLKQSPEGRVVSVSSEAHRFARFDINDLQLKERPYNGFNAYCISKLCNIWFTRKLASLTSNSKLTVNCLHPGFVASNFGKSTSLLFKSTIKLLQPFAVNSEKGASTSVYLASSDQVKDISGKYFKDKKIKSPGRKALNDSYADVLWEKSAALTQLDIHRVKLS